MSGPMGLFMVGPGSFWLFGDKKLRSAEWKMFNWKVFYTAMYILFFDFYSAGVVWPANLIYIEKFSCRAFGSASTKPRIFNAQSMH